MNMVLGSHRRSTSVGRWAVLAAATLLAACSDGGDSATSDTDSTTPPTVVAQTTAVPEPPATDDDVETEPTAPATTAAVTTTTTPPPRQVPVGERWTETVIAADLTGLGAVEASVLSDTEVWATIGRYNSTLVVRTLDGGDTWNEVSIEEPPASGAARIGEIVRGPDGRLVARSTVGSDCGFAEPAPDGFTNVGPCFALRTVFHVSDDDGATWTRIDPTGLEPPADSLVVVADITATTDGFAAIGTVRGPDWYAQIWTSPDAATWTRGAQLRGGTGPMSGRSIEPGGDDLVALALEHPCAIPAFNSRGAGWALGVNWASHPRVFTGTGNDEMQLAGPDKLPLAPTPLSVDCAVDEAAGLAGVPYPALQLTEMAGAPTIVERGVAAGDGAPPAPRIARFEADGWELVESEVLDAVDPEEVAAVDFVPARTASDPSLLVGLVPESGPRLSTRSVVQGRAAVVESVQSIIARTIHDVVGVGDSILVFGRLDLDPFDSFVGGSEPQTVSVWRSAATEGELTPCDLEPGGACREADLTAHPDHPDFSGRSLAGIDLTFATVGDASFEGADLSNAVLWAVGADGEGSPNFVDAVLRGASLSAAEVGSLDGADVSEAQATDLEAESAIGTIFDGANLSSAVLGDATGASFVGADLNRGEFGFSEFPAAGTFAPGQLDGAELILILPEGEPGGEVSLAGWDLTGAQISGPSFEGEQRIVVTDLSDAVLDGVTFYSADLSGVDPDVDLTDVDVWDNSLCPDGLPPDDGPIGTCVRSG